MQISDQTANAKADLIIRWVYMYEGAFSNVAALSSVIDVLLMVPTAF